MDWLVLIGGVVSAWAMLSVLGRERQRRVRELDFAAAARRQAAARGTARQRRAVAVLSSEPLN